MLNYLSERTIVTRLILIFGVVALCAGCRPAGNHFSAEDSGGQLDKVVEKYATFYEQVLLQNNRLPARFPRSLKADGTLKMVGTADGDSGYFPGILWMLYEYSQDEVWKNRAIRFTEYLEDQLYNVQGSDAGLKMVCSFGRAFTHTGEIRYFNILEQAARSLSLRFNSQVGCLNFGDNSSPRYHFPVTIDHLMSLELPLWAFRQTSDPVYLNIVNSHARKILQEHIGPDYRIFQVVDFDPVSGEVRSKNNNFGTDEASDWARGQAKAVYGFTRLYEITQKAEYLETAEKLADNYLEHPNLPDDKIPYWDLLAPGIPEEPRDASAAAIMASALINLSQLSGKNHRYLQAAAQMLETLSSPAYFNFHSNQGFLLKQVTIDKPGDLEVNTSSIMADYFYLEALLKWYRNSEKAS